MDKSLRNSRRTTSGQRSFRRFSRTLAALTTLLAVAGVNAGIVISSDDREFSDEVGPGEQRAHLYTAESSGSHIFRLDWDVSDSDVDMVITRENGAVIKRANYSSDSSPMEIDSLWLSAGHSVYAKVLGQRGRVPYRLVVASPTDGQTSMRFDSVRTERQQAWYYFSVDKAESFDFTLDWRQQASDADLVLTDIDSNIIASARESDGSNAQEKLTVKLESDKLYYAKVFVIDGERVDYSLSISESDDGGGSSSGGSSSSGSSSSGSSSSGSSSSGSSSSGSSSSGSSSSGSSSSGSSSSSSGGSSSGGSSSGGSSSSGGGLPDMVFGKDTTPASSGWSKPAVNALYNDPVYGSQMRRLTSAEGTRFNRNDYSRRQPENADGTLFFTYHGAAQFRIYNVADGSDYLTTNIHPGGEPQWHPDNPDLIRYLDGSNRSVGSLKIYELDVTTGNTRVIADLTAQIQSAFPGALYIADAAEGSPSADGNRYGWTVFNFDEDAIGFVTYDLSTNRLLGTLALDSRGEPNWISVTPSGEHVILSWAANGFDAFVDSTVAFNVDFSGANEIVDSAEHSDTAINAAGQDVYVYIDFGDGAAKVYNLETRQTYALFNIYNENTSTSIHISGKGYDKPGWAVFSTYNCHGNVGWACYKVFAVELHPDNPRIANLAHTYNCGNNYWTETHATTNRSLSRIYFNSDGGSCGIDAEVYSIDLDLPDAR